MAAKDTSSDPEPLGYFPSAVPPLISAPHSLSNYQTPCNRRSEVNTHFLVFVARPNNRVIPPQHQRYTSSNSEALGYCSRLSVSSAVMEFSSAITVQLPDIL